MSKMGTEYIKQIECQFGDVLPNNEAICSYCGQRYGDHYGLECPEPISPFALPSNAYDKYFTPPNGNNEHDNKQ